MPNPVALNPMMLYDLLQKKPSAIIGANVLNEIIYATDTIRDILGWSASELSGKSLLTIVPERLQERHLQSFNTFVKSNKTTLGERPLRVPALHKDGHEVPVELSIGSFHDDGDLRIIALIRDMADFVEIEEESEKLRHELNYIRSITYNIGEGIIAIDKQGKIRLVNPHAESMLGYKEFEIVGKSGHNVLHFQHDKDSCEIQTTLKDGITREVADDFFAKKDSSLVNISYIASPIKRLGSIDGTVISFIDISEKKKAEQKYRSLVELSPYPICTYQDGKFTYTNQAGLDLVGAKSIDDVVGKNVLDFIHPDSKKIVSERMNSVIVERKQQKLQSEKIIRLDGTVADIEVVSMPLNGNSALTIIHDITDKVNYENRLRYSENLYRTVVDYAADLIVVTNEDGVIQFMNHPSHFAVLGYDNGELLGKPLQAVIHPEDRLSTEEQNALYHKLINGGVTEKKEVRMLAKNGSYIWVEGIATAILTGEGLQYFLTISRDITAQKKYIAEMENLLGAMPILVWALDSNGKITYCNEQWYEYTGIEKGSDRNDWSLFIHPNFQEKSKVLWEDALRKGNPIQIENKYRHKSGEYNWFMVNIVPIREDGNAISKWIGTATNINEKKLSEEYKARLAAIVDSSNDAIIGIDLQGIITAWNGAAEKFYEYNRVDVIGQNITIVIPDNKSLEFDGIMNRIARGLSVDSLHTTRMKRGKDEIKVIETMSPVRDATDTIIGASAIVRPESQ